MINFFGMVHQCGGAGTEALGAVELLRSHDVPVRFIVPMGYQNLYEDWRIDEGNPAANYLRSIGVELAVYEPGMFAKCKVLMSFSELKLFDYIREHGDRPQYLLYSDCMSFATDVEIDAYREGLIDEFFFQTQTVADRAAPQIARRAQKSVKYRPGYRAFINTRSPYMPLRFSLDRASDTFGVCHVSSDDASKWHSNTWRMFCGVNAPCGTRVQIEVAGWGSNAEEKLGDPTVEGNRWHGKLNLLLHDHIYDSRTVAELYARNHVLIHVCDYTSEESLGRVFLEAMASGVVVISDRRGGALDLIKHGETGYLVDTPDEAAYYASHLAFNPQLRKFMASYAYAELVTSGHGNADACWPWWSDVCERNFGC